MTTKLTRTPGIYLVGFMGSGKTTIGSMLAYELGWKFVDLDDDIETAAHKEIREIFDAEGEAEFRRKEHDALVKRIHGVQSGHPLVLSLGGGAYSQEANYALLNENGVSIWLDVPLQMILERIAGQTHRPLARDAEKFARLFEDRQPSYARADFRIPITSNDAHIAVRTILALPLFSYVAP